MSIKNQDIQGDHVIRMKVPSTGNAASTGVQVVARAPFACTVQSITFTPDSGVTADATNNATLQVTNRTTGAGTTSVASVTTTTGFGMTAYTPATIAVSATAANLNLAAGDVISLDKTVGGTGVIIPAGLVEIVVRAR